MGFVSSLIGGQNNFKSNPGYIGGKSDANDQRLGQTLGVGSASGGPYQSAIQGGLGLGDQFQQGMQSGAQAYGQANQGLSGLAGQLQQQADGQGPSLAQNQLREGTERTQNLAAGQLAGQRGINPALAARMIAGQQANANQQMAGQSADLRMQEQMAARQQLAGVLGQQMQGGLSQYGMGAQGAGNFFGTAGQLGLGQQGLALQDYNNANARYLQAQQGNQHQQMAADSINAGVSQNNANNAQSMGGGIIGGVAGALGLAKGGKVFTPKDLTPADKATLSKDWSLDAPEKATDTGTTHGAGAIMPVPTKMAMGGDVGMNPGLVQLGQALRQKMQAQQAVPMMGGGPVQGHASVPGDSEKNDTVPALLSPGEIVIPRSKAKDPDAAKEFVEAIASHDGPKEEEAEGYGAVLKKIRELESHVKKMAGGGKVC